MSIGNTIHKLMDTTNSFVFCYECDQYVFDKQVTVELNSFEGEDFILRMLGCKRHPYAMRIGYRWYN